VAIGLPYRTASVQDLDSIELGLLGNTISLRADSTSAVSTMAVAIGVGAITCKVGEEGGTAFKVRVRGRDTGVDNIDAGAGASTVIIDVGSAATVLVGDAGETPG
jgi:hypothetical protein